MDILPAGVNGPRVGGRGRSPGIVMSLKSGWAGLAVLMPVLTRTSRWRSARVRLAANFKALRIPYWKKDQSHHAIDCSHSKKKIKLISK